MNCACIKSLSNFYFIHGKQFKHRLNISKSFCCLLKLLLFISTEPCPNLCRITQNTHTFAAVVTKNDWDEFNLSCSLLDLKDVLDTSCGGWSAHCLLEHLQNYINHCNLFVVGDLRRTKLYNFRFTKVFVYRFNSGIFKLYVISS